MATNVLLDIEQKMCTFSKGQRSIAQYVINNYQKAAFMTAAKLGVASNVSESTVVRFAFEIGYDGYPEFQTDLQETIKNKLTSVQRIEVADEQIGGGDILNNVLNIDIEKIKRTIEETSRSNFDGAVNSIVNANKVYVLGTRSASVLASFLSLYLNIILKRVILVQATSSSEMFEQIIHIEKDDIIIGISFPRYSKKTSKALEFAKNVGATVISITDSKASPLAKLSDYFLQARSDMVSFVDSLVAPLSLINALIVAVGLKKKETAKDTFEKLENIWDKYDVYEKTGDI